MSGSESEYVELSVTDTQTVEEVATALRVDGDLIELASRQPPVEATIEALDE